jgi:hypothetical protein
LKETNKVKQMDYFIKRALKFLKRALRCVASQQAKNGLLGAAARGPAAQGSISFLHGPTEVVS